MFRSNVIAKKKAARSTSQPVERVLYYSVALSSAHGGRRLTISFTDPTVLRQVDLGALCRALVSCGVASEASRRGDRIIVDVTTARWIRMQDNVRNETLWDLLYRVFFQMLLYSSPALGEHEWTFQFIGHEGRSKLNERELRNSMVEPLWRRDMLITQPVRLRPEDNNHGNRLD